MNITTLDNGCIKVLDGSNILILVPGSDFSEYPDDVKDACTSAWTEDLISEYKQKTSAIGRISSSNGDAQLIAACKFEAQLSLDSLAISWGYDNIVSAASYSNSTNPQFKSESLALVNWRDEVWSFAYEILNKIESGVLSAPKSVDDFLLMLPKAPERPVA